MQEVKEIREVTLTDYLSILLKWKKFLIINLLIVSIITTGLTFLIPEKYKSTATIMIEEDSGSGLLSGIMPGVGSVLGGALFGQGGESEDKIFAFLESRKMLLMIIDKFNLIQYYEISDYQVDKSLKAIKNDIDFDMTENGLIQISFIHKDPKIAADIVDFVIQQLKNINSEFAFKHATNYRTFIEKRYNKNLIDLHDAEEGFELFQENYGIYAIPEQLEIVFTALADLEGKLAMKELEADYIKEIQGTEAPQYRNISTEVRILKNKINDITNGKATTDQSLLSIQLNKIPVIQKKYMRLFRNIEIQNKLLEVTLPLYEQALMEEQKNIPTIIILDNPNVPELKDSPKKAYIIIGIFLLFLFIHIYFAIRWERMSKEGHRGNNLFEQKEYSFFSRLSKFYNLKIN